MKLPGYLPVFFMLIFLMFFSCRKTYNPPAIQSGSHFLVVDGFISTGNHVASTIILSRSVNLSEANTTLPVLNASVVIQSSDGNSYDLTDTSGTGIYASQPLSLDSTKQYRLFIRTNDDRNEYQSDFVPVKQSPPMDSLTWELTGDPDPRIGNQAIHIYVNAHDPANATHYYRWDFLQTYKHFATYRTYLGLDGDSIYSFPLTYDTYTCWSTIPPRNFSIGTSIALSHDVISHSQVALIGEGDATMNIGSSFQIRQFPLTEQGYFYWSTVLKNSQSLGSLFDVQPAQIKGNIHCITDSSLNAFGFVSASTVNDMRIYISNKSLPGWNAQHFDSTSIACQTITLDVDPLNTLAWNYSDTSYGPYEFETPVFTTYLVIAPKACLDCRYQGGTNVRPAFWPRYD